jgi:GNAT superfamily N-acetyltransferase
MMMIKIRKANISDVESLFRCHDYFMEHHIKRDKRFTLKTGAKEKWIDQITESVKDPCTLVLAAENQSVIVGCAYVIIRKGAIDFGPEKIGYLCDVYVGPDFRRQGIARRFLLFAQEWLRENGINTIEASWSPNSTEAAHTWSALGFIPLSVSGQLKF